MTSDDDFITIDQPEFVDHVDHQLIGPGPGSDGVPVIFGIQAENTLSPIGVARLVGGDFLSVELDKKIAAPHALFGTKSIVGPIVD